MPAVENSERYRQLFLGGCLGIGLSQRSGTDPHVCFEVLVNDDDWWTPLKSNGGGISSYWLVDLQRQLAAAEAWCENHCDEAWSTDGRIYGWNFREGR